MSVAREEKEFQKAMSHTPGYSSQLNKIGRSFTRWVIFILNNFCLCRVIRII